MRRSCLEPNIIHLLGKTISLLLNLHPMLSLVQLTFLH